MFHVFHVVVEFSDPSISPYHCVLKVPLVNALGENNHRSVIAAHNVECEFYEHFNDLDGFLLSRVFATKKCGYRTLGMILMESFVGRAETIDLFKEPTDGQVMFAARILAQLQFCARDPRRMEWWMKKEQTICLEELYTCFIPTYYPMLIENKPEFAPLIRQLQPLSNRSFGLYALRDLPRQYKAITICHGDYHSNNLMFKLLEDGRITDELITVIDWQLTFYGSALFDLGKFISLSLNHEKRERIKKDAFSAYFNELQHLYAGTGRQPDFNYEQGFELYELSICHTATVLLEFLPYMNQMHGHKEGWGPRIQVLEERTKSLARTVLPLIEKYGLERFAGQN